MARLPGLCVSQHEHIALDTRRKYLRHPHAAVKSNPDNQPGRLDDDSDAANHKETIPKSGFTPVENRTDIVTISRYGTGGAMGNGVVLHDQLGVIESWEVTKNWIRENVRGYLEQNPDVQIAGINPLEHYLSWGFDEGRAF